MIRRVNVLALLIIGALALAFSGSAAAKTCERVIEGNDQIQYNKSKLVVGADCDKLKVTLKHVGQLPRKQMGHNWVLALTKHFQDIAQSAASAGLDSGYIPDDDRIIAHTDLIGGGESTSITFDVSQLKAGNDYTYFCSFPGHYGTMQGKLVVK